MELPSSSIERLKSLKEKTEASSYAEVTKSAYRLYDWLIDLSEEGNSFLIKDEDGNIKELKLFI